MAAPQKGVAYTFYISLVDSADPSKFKIDPTIASGDFNVSKDGGALTTVDTLPVVSPSGSPMVKVDLSATEMDADEINVVAVDLAGDEWQELVFAIEINGINAQQIDDIATAVWNKTLPLS